MAEYLLDTHTFLWMRFNEDKLSNKVKRIIENTKNRLYISVASLWEIAIKYSLDKIAIGRHDDYIGNLPHK